MAVLISSDIQYSNVKMDQKGRVIVCDLDDLEITGANVYMQCGMSSENKNTREEYSAKILPQLLLERKNSNFVGGDWNVIILRSDCTHNPESKLSPSLAKLIKIFQYTDSFKQIFPHDMTTKSHYYDFPKLGGTHIDRLPS